MKRVLDIHETMLIWRALQALRRKLERDAESPIFPESVRAADIRDGATIEDLAKLICDNPTITIGRDP